MDLPKHLREFDDAPTSRKWLMDNTLQSLNKRFPIEDDQYRLELHNVRPEGPQEFGLERQKNALLRDEQLRIPIKGTWKLVHKETGATLDERDDTVMHLPYLTDRGTIIHRGNEYTGVSQSRLKPGVYTRRKRSGEVEAFYNVLPGTGRTFRTWLEPSTGVFKVNVGQANIPLYPMMNAMGVTDKQLSDTWGPAILEANMKARSGQALEKLYTRFAGSKAQPVASDTERKQRLIEMLQNSKLDPDVVAKTLGLKNKSGVDPEVLMRTTHKMLAISRGEEKPDDRDSPMFSNVLSIEDLIPERIDKDAGRNARTLLWKARHDRSLKRVPVGALNPYVYNYILGSRLMAASEETNPLSLLEQMHRITKMGEGGIGDSESVTDEARNVNIGQAGFVDPISGPESGTIGVDTRAAYRTFKGKDKQMYAEFKNPKTGQMEFLKPEHTDGKIIAFPKEMDSKSSTATAIVNGAVREVPKDKVDLEIPSFAHMMSPNINLNPMPTAVQAARQFYASKFWSQYMPQANGEVPLVDTLMPDGRETFSEYYGKKIGALKAPVAGTVTRITDGNIFISGTDGKKHTIELTKDFPFNRVTGLTYTPSVKTGDAVDAGQMVAHSNFIHPKTGALSLGRNLRVAVAPYRGFSHEDAIVISESAAKKLATQRLMGFDQDAKQGVEIDRNRYISLFPQKFTKEQSELVDDNGIVKPGTTLHYGDPIIMATGPKLLTAEDAQLGKLHKALRNAHTDKSVIWEHNYPGMVTDAVRTRSGAKVNVSCAVPVEVGDKLSPRYALKGTVGLIQPDDKMPRDAATNHPYDMLLNPMGILSRVAPGQLIELQLGKIAERTGKPMRLPQLPPEEGWNEWARKQLAANKIPEKEDVFDPELGRNIKPVATGNMYVLAFHHLAEKKSSGRGSSGGSYDLNEMPARGGEESQMAKRMSGMDMNALLSHGATEVARDSQIIRGARNEDYWKALKLGRPLPEPKVPFIYNKFLALLKAGGINVRDQGDVLKLMPMMDDDIKQLSHGEIHSSAMVDDNLEAIPGGLFDPGKAGGTIGNNWTHVTLAEPLPNPVFEEPIRRLLGLREQDFYNVLAGRQDLNGMTGGAAIQSALKNIDIDTAIAKGRQDATRLRGANRDNAVKTVGYLEAAKEQGIHPSQWMLTRVPILPPIFRPVSRLGDITMTSDINELYRDLIETNNAIKDLRKELPEAAVHNEKENLYKAVSAVFGLGDPITPENKSKRLKGAIRTIIGDSPKFGLFNSRVMSKPVDAVGRAVVTPDPNLDMDQVGIPAESAWKLYKDFVLRRLVRQNIPSLRALEMIDKKDPEAKKALTDEMQERPVILDRAPTWHKFNLLAFYPHMVDGNTIQTSPLITKGFNLDHDGDQMNFHVPVSEKAVEQAKHKMLPSKNLFSLTDLKSPMHTPTQEMSLGLYMMSRNATKKPTRKFASLDAAKAAYRKGELGLNDPIEVGV